MVPFSITIEQAGALSGSIVVLFWGAGVFMLPITITYTLVAYFVFKGKVRHAVDPCVAWRSR
jgi:cytochrome d ubiquinol oxidase subunit II